MQKEKALKIGIIGGTGLAQIEKLAVKEKLDLDTPFGKPSQPILYGELEGKDVYFLSRHGLGHRHAPHEINYRANIYALKSLGTEMIISVSAVGSMKEQIIPGNIVFPDQFIDRTRQRVNTFFEKGIVVHVAFADPTCAHLRDYLYRSAQGLGITSQNGGTYLCIDGPQFSTRAESLLYRSYKVDVIGMTNVTEARLAREAEMCYATIALATDYDCWHEEEEDVSVTAVMKLLSENVQKAKSIISEVLTRIEPYPCVCRSAVANAITTQRTAISEETKKRLDLLVGKYI